MKHHILIILLCLLLVCAGCSKETPLVTPDPTPTAPAETSEPEPAKPEPMPEPEPVPDPVFVEPEYEPGAAVTVDGTTLSQSFLIEQETYVDLKELTDALGIPLTMDAAGQARFSWNGQDVIMQLGTPAARRACNSQRIVPDPGSRPVRPAGHQRLSRYRAEPSVLHSCGRAVGDP